MKKITALKITVASLLFAMFSTAQAAIISIMPASTEVQVGDLFSLDIMFSGEDGENLGDYDLSVMFDDSIIMLQGWSAPSGNGFGEGNEELLSSAGGFNVSDISFWLIEELQDDQADEFVLVTLNFRAMMVGMTELMFDDQSALVGDEFGNQIRSPSLLSAMVTVTERDGDVPAPATLLLATLLIPFMRRRKLF